SMGVRTMGKPFLKWVGGKRQLLPELLKHVPTKFGDYYEPFLGGGALFFELASQNRISVAHLSDMNAHLINCYRWVRDAPQSIGNMVSALACNHSLANFKQARVDLTAPGTDEPDRAAIFIYLNKTCFNGLYRVNSKGGFNVPWDPSKKPEAMNWEFINTASEALADADLHHGDFSVAANSVKAGDFVYCDPPYAPLSATSSFASYTAKGFDTMDQIKLASTAFALKRRGVNVLLSNSSAPLIRDIYSAKEWTIEEVQARRSVNSDATKRGKITELLIY
ncbi:MAG: DNA adenine methylase, partial [Dehalococcoidia bacterium]|nr:DNA adenine methylase [Dehalococcoidia bacterium]